MNCAYQTASCQLQTYKFGQTHAPMQFQASPFYWAGRGFPHGLSKKEPTYAERLGPLILKIFTLTEH